MIEIRIDGRGGQGNVVAAYMLAEAGFEAGRDVQAFPSFGPERRGAPVAAFVRISDQPIKRRNQIREPQFVIVQDPSLLHGAGIADGVRMGGGILVNSARTNPSKRDPARCEISGRAGIRDGAGSPGRNRYRTPPCWRRFSTLTDLFPLVALETSSGAAVRGRIAQRNLQLMRAAAARVPPGRGRRTARACRQLKARRRWLMRSRYAGRR